MGVNCRATLNEGADWRKVGQVASVLLGAKMRRESLGKDGWLIVVEGFGYGKFSPWISEPSYIDIHVCGDAETNAAAYQINQSDGMPYQMSYNMERRSLYPKASAAKIALAEAIAKFFGGEFLYNDYNGRKRKFPTLKKFTGEREAEYYRFQKALEALKPLTQADIDRCAKHAAY